MLYPKLKDFMFWGDISRGCDLLLKLTAPETGAGDKQLMVDLGYCRSESSVKGTGQLTLSLVFFFYFPIFPSCSFSLGAPNASKPEPILPGLSSLLCTLH